MASLGQQNYLTARYRRYARPSPQQSTNMLSVMRQATLLCLALMLTQGAWAQYTIYAAETQAGSLGGNTAAYGGVQRWDFASTGGAASAGTGIAAGDVHDPAGLVFQNGNLYVGNRWGNTQGLGSVQAFAWNGSGLTGGGTIASQASSSDQGWHGFRFAPNGDMFVTTANNGTRRFRDSGGGYADIGGVSNGQVRDVWISPDGKKMVTTGVGNALHITDVLANGFGGSVNYVMSGSNASHQMAYHDGALFVTSFNSNQVFKVNLDASFNPVSDSAILNVAGAIGITFSPDGKEMLVSSHTGNVINRFLDSGGTWVSNGSIATGHNMGYLAAVPEPGTMALLGAGALALIRRRRK